MSLVGITTLFVVCFLSNPEMDVSPQNRSVDLNAEVKSDLPNHFLTSYDEARKLAARNNVPLLLHFDATWCGACRRMEAEVMSRPAIKALLSSFVVGVKIDADQYKHLIREYGISTLPTEVVVMPDGSRGNRFVGAATLSEYSQRLRSLGNRSIETIADKKKPEASSPSATRSCLIVKHDGKMVGLGGFSPVALTNSRQWKRGTGEFVASHEGVDYFFQNQQEADDFAKAPSKYIPRLHGCDPVALFRENVATPGAIEYGSFFEGKVFFFASVENRSRFESNPRWYVGIRADNATANENSYPFLQPAGVNN